MAIQMNGAVSHVDNSAPTNPVRFLIPMTLSAIQMAVQFSRNLLEAYEWAKEMDRKAKLAFPYLTNED